MVFDEISKLRFMYGAARMEISDLNERISTLETELEKYVAPLQKAERGRADDYSKEHGKSFPDVFEVRAYLVLAMHRGESYKAACLGAAEDFDLNYETVKKAHRKVELVACLEYVENWQDKKFFWGR
jgi:hypothetical protein